MIRTRFQRLGSAPVAAAVLAGACALGPSAPAVASVSVDAPRALQRVSPVGGDLVAAATRAAERGPDGRAGLTGRPANAVSPDGDRLLWMFNGTNGALPSRGGESTKALATRTEQGWNNQVLYPERILGPRSQPWGLSAYAANASLTRFAGLATARTAYPQRPPSDLVLADGAHQGTWPSPDVPEMWEPIAGAWSAFEPGSGDAFSLDAGGLAVKYPFADQSLVTGIGRTPILRGDSIWFTSQNRLTADVPAPPPWFASVPQVYVREGSGAPRFIGRFPDGTPAASSLLVDVDAGGRNALLSLTDDMGATTVYLYEAASGDLTLVGQGQRGAPGQATEADGFAFSADGSALLINTTAALLPEDTDARLDAYRHDIASGELRLLSVHGARGNGNTSSVCRNVPLGIIDSSCAARIVAANDDATAVYFSSSELLVDSPARAQQALYQWTLERAEAVDPSDPTDGPLVGLGINAVAAVEISAAGDLAIETGPSSGASAPGITLQSRHDLLLYRPDDGGLECVTCDLAGSASTTISSDNLVFSLANGFAGPAFTEDGQLLFFTSTGRLVAADGDRGADGYALDTRTGELALVTPGAGDIGAALAAISPDGARVFFYGFEQLTGPDAGVNGRSRLYVAATDLPAITTQEAAGPPECSSNCRLVSPPQFGAVDSVVTATPNDDNHGPGGGRVTGVQPKWPSSQKALRRIAKAQGMTLRLENVPQDSRQRVSARVSWPGKKGTRVVVSTKPVPASASTRLKLSARRRAAVRQAMRRHTVRIEVVITGGDRPVIDRRTVKRVKDRI